jgi:hypothetical protein
MFAMACPVSRTSSGLQMPSKPRLNTKAASRRAGHEPPARSDSSSSLRDAAYDAIKHRIITCAFKPGEYINELQLAALLKPLTG